MTGVVEQSLVPNGTTHVAFTPTAFLERLAVLVPRRAFEVDVLKCPRCGGRLRLIALIEASAVARRILTHLALPADVPRPALARAPPNSGGDD